MRFWIYIIGSLLFIAAAIFELGCHDCGHWEPRKKKQGGKSGSRILREEPYRGQPSATAPQWKEVMPQMGYWSKRFCPGREDCVFDALARVELHNPASHGEVYAEIRCGWWINEGPIASSTIKRVRVRPGVTVAVELQQTFTAPDQLIGDLERRIDVIFTRGKP